MPDKEVSTLHEWLGFFENTVPYVTAYGIAYTIVHFIFKYFSEGRKAELKELVEEINRPRDEVINYQFGELTKAIDRLNQSIRDIEK